MTTAAASPAASSREASSPAGLSHRQILVILSGLMLGMFLAALDQTIVSTAVRTIADDLKGLDQQAWVTTAYLITSTISTPLYGKLSDMYGRKPFFLAAISIFVIGSIACTFSTSMYMLAAFRALQGIGAGGLMSLALAIIADIVPARERAKYQGYFLAVFGTSSVLGPVIGGAFSGVDSIAGIDGWRWVFLVNVPIGIIALFVVAKVLNIPGNSKDASKRKKVDWWGATALIVGLVPLLLVAEQGREWGWDATGSLICYIVGAVGLIGFVIVEKFMGDDALIPLKLFRSGVFSITAGGGLLVGLAMFGGIAMLPQYMQIVRGASPTESGFLMLPFVGGMMVFSVISGQITSRTGRYKIFPVIGTALLTGAAVLFHFRLTADTSFGELSGYMVMFGAGLGLCMQTLTLAAQNAVPVRDIGVASSTSTMTRQLGGTLGTAVFLSMLFSTVGTKIGDAFKSAANTPEFQNALAHPSGGAQSAQVAQQMAQGPQGMAALSGKVMQDSSFLQHIDHNLAHPFFVGFSNSMQMVFLAASIVAAVAFLVFLFMKEIPLRNTSGVQEKAAAAAEAGSDGPVTAGAGASLLDETAGPVRSIDPNEDRELVHAMANGDIGEPNGNGANGSGRHGAAQVVASAGEFAPRAPGAHRIRAEEMTAAQMSTAQMSTGGNGTGPGGIPVHGTVHRGGGEPVPGAVLTLIDTGGRQVGRATAGPEGGYRLDAPTAGRYVLIASAGAHQPEASTITVGGEPLGVDLMLTGTAGLTGLVTSASSGQPVVGATTTLADARGEVVGAETTDERGLYEFRELVAGEYTLVVSA
ncbi:MFS transporter, partial [Sciscionella sediminilitoris]|uniref:MFS transporter n=1 Tax=Sciscionella sediminilitoris TaxID=1445613 RepID=UPI0004DEF949